MQQIVVPSILSDCACALLSLPPPPSDFRKDYTRLSFFKQRFPGVPLLALTVRAGGPCCSQARRWPAPELFPATAAQPAPAAAACCAALVLAPAGNRHAAGAA